MYILFFYFKTTFLTVLSETGTDLQKKHKIVFYFPAGRISYTLTDMKLKQC